MLLPSSTCHNSVTRTDAVYRNRANLQHCFCFVFDSEAINYDDKDPRTRTSSAEKTTHTDGRSQGPSGGTPTVGRCRSLGKFSKGKKIR